MQYNKSRLAWIYTTSNENMGSQFLQPFTKLKGQKQRKRHERTRTNTNEGWVVQKKALDKADEVVNVGKEEGRFSELN